MPGRCEANGAARPLVVLMGVAGSGKSTVGPRLAARLGVGFADADDVHTGAAKAHMAAGHPLGDAEREPWLDRLHAILVAHTADGLVLACSALKPAYRARLAGETLSPIFVTLAVPRDELARRLAARTGHYAGPALLPSQLADLQLDDAVAVVDGTRPVDEVVDAAATAVERAGNR
jgi:carbohydrate kinase (thermoresistant glucokinase family)